MKAATPSELRAGWPVRRASLVSCLFVTSALVFSGCANSYQVKVDSLAKPKAEQVLSYEIHNSNPLLSDDSLRYKEASDFVKTALSGKGLYEAPDKVKPDIVVDLDYGIRPPESRREIISEPIYITRRGAVRYQSVQSGVDARGNPIYTTIAIQEPDTTEFAGFRDVPVTITVYEKYIRLTARENAPAQEGRPPAEIWTVDVTSEGESRDLRKHLPVLVAASINYIGKDSQGQKTIKMKDSDRDVAFVKQGM